MSELKLDKCREEFPGFLEVGKVYHWPRLTKVNWRETSWHNDATPSWMFRTAWGMHVKLWIAEDDEASRDNPYMNKYSITLLNESGNYVCHVADGDTDSLEEVQEVLCRLRDSLNE